MDLPIWSDEWTLFATWGDLPFAVAGVILCLLLVVWWRQQSQGWFRVMVATFLAALLLAIASYYIFVVPPYTAGCPQGCTGWRGYPFRVAEFMVIGRSILGPGDFALNVLILWLLWLTASVIWRLLATALQLETRTRRGKILFYLFIVIGPWAILPRVLNPPQLQVVGEDQRLANNALRAAEFTYGITGLWVQRLALEDVRRDPAAAVATSAQAGEGNEVCLRGYTWFFVPWRRYRIGLDPSGATALSLLELPLEGSCWDQPPLSQ